MNERGLNQNHSSELRKTTRVKSCKKQAKKPSE